jgi:hypothetical protein
MRAGTLATARTSVTLADELDVLGRATLTGDPLQSGREKVAAAPASARERAQLRD